MKVRLKSAADTETRDDYGCESQSARHRRCRFTGPAADFHVVAELGWDDARYSASVTAVSTSAWLALS